MIQTVIALVLLLMTRNHYDNPKMALRGSKTFKFNLGWTVLVTSGFGFAIEGIGGLLKPVNPDFFFQMAHETMYAAFFIVGIVALLESRERVPVDSWRLGFAMSFFVEGLVFYGHALEQNGTEQALHFVMVAFSWQTAACFVWAVRSSDSFLPHLLALGGMLAKGIWFFVIAHILYSDTFGLDGKYYMLADVYVSSGVVIMVLFSSLGCCISAGRAGAYAEDEEDYAKVDPNPPPQI